MKTVEEYLSALQPLTAADPSGLIDPGTREPVPYDGVLYKSDAVFALVNRILSDCCAKNALLKRKNRSAI